MYGRSSNYVIVNLWLYFKAFVGSTFVVVDLHEDDRCDRNRYKKSLIKRKKADNSYFERVEQFKYLGSTLTYQNSIQE
jgi:hypothetical protein